MSSNKQCIKFILHTYELTSGWPEAFAIAMTAKARTKFAPLRFEIQMIVSETE